MSIRRSDPFLDASLHLYKRVCPSSGLLARRLVRNAFVKIAENGVMQDGDASFVVVVYMALFFNDAKVAKMVEYVEKSLGNSF